MNKPPSGSITFSTFGVMVASVVAGFVQSEGAVWVMSAPTALLLTAVGAGVTQRAINSDIKQSGFKIKYMIVGFISRVPKIWMWVFHAVTCRFSSSSAHSSSQSPFQDHWDLQTVCKFKHMSFPVFMWKGWKEIILQIIEPDNRRIVVLFSLHYSVWLRVRVTSAVNHVIAALTSCPVDEESAMCCCLMFTTVIKEICRFKSYCFCKSAQLTQSHLHLVTLCGHFFRHYLSGCSTRRRWHPHS